MAEGMRQQPKHRQGTGARPGALQPCLDHRMGLTGDQHLGGATNHRLIPGQVVEEDLGYLFTRGGGQGVAEHPSRKRGSERRPYGVDQPCGDVSGQAPAKNRHTVR